MSDRIPHPLRLCRKPVAALAGLALALVIPSGAALAAPGADSPPSGTQGQAALQAQAEELAGQIQSEGRSLDEVDGEYNAALIRDQQLQATQASLRSRIASTSVQVTKSRQELQSQAIFAYVTGGDPVVNFSSGKAGADPSLTVSYAEIIAGGQKRAVVAYRAVLATQVRQSAALAVAASQARVVLSALQSDQASAQSSLAARQGTLEQVKGQIAVMVAQVQAQQARAEHASVEASLHQEGQQLPPAAPSLPARLNSTGPDPSTTAAPSSAPVNPTPVVHAPTSSGQPATTEAPATTSTTSTTAPPPTPTTDPPQPVGGNYPARGASIAIAYARAQLGKPYQWGGAGPSSFDCSGLVMMAWDQAGVYFPHLAQDQYDMTERIPLADLLPGDLVFFGTPSDVYHVGIYVGGGQMIDAPETGQYVSYSSIYWDGLLGAGRVEG